jgi:hypothetical protein
MQIEPFDRGGLEQVEPFALRYAFDDVDQHDVAQLFGGDPVRGGRADEARADDCDLGTHRHSFRQLQIADCVCRIPMRSAIARLQVSLINAL